ncbi:peptide chain release factor N(5)-glutamine methyltransferase [Streptococcus halichoeri]|uniref:peptide chain release factor N(5)-glutamine methyltransferase n=1 Tax=Streptococcus halichoeri TaxID=254785 RepID=UPI001358596A|nr:peptide chain release factor N(5)-glutamine methyltransferase [Streptococcus halichoeri]
MNYAQLIQRYSLELVAVDEEPQNLIYVFKELKAWTTLDFVLHQNQAATDADQKLLQAIMQQLLQHRSPQYITGKAYFRDLVLTVDERVLIPRPETEELVELILQENDNSYKRVLDVGTGSGAIAIALKKARPEWQVVASDISADALDVAQQNARDLGIQLDFIQSDLLSAITGSFDIIVSNPPYIAPEDQAEVAVNVLASEPHLALFAAEHGFAAYRGLLSQTTAHLTNQGKIYLEIGYKQAKQVQELSKLYLPEKRLRILQDSYGKDRMVAIDD